MISRDLRKPGLQPRHWRKRAPCKKAMEAALVEAADAALEVAVLAAGTRYDRHHQRLERARKAAGGEAASGKATGATRAVGAMAGLKKGFLL